MGRSVCCLCMRLSNPEPLTIEIRARSVHNVISRIATFRKEDGIWKVYNVLPLVLYQYFYIKRQCKCLNNSSS
jgi:hypothetical protein